VMRILRTFSTLVIIIVHYVARSFCETIKLPKEMPKIAKCLKCLKLRYSIDFKRAERSDINKSSIFNSGLSGLGIFPVYPG
jgi:hypothetical protein